MCVHVPAPAPAAELALRGMCAWQAAIVMRDDDVDAVLLDMTWHALSRALCNPNLDSRSIAASLVQGGVLTVSAFG
jgi:hypothetical protein